jgi:hypothetical protein
LVEVKFSVLFSLWKSIRRLVRTFFIDTRGEECQLNRPARICPVDADSIWAPLQLAVQ